MTTFENIAVALLGATYVLSLIVIFRRHFHRGFVFSPFATANLFFFFTVSPAFFFGPSVGIGESYFPLLVFILAYLAIVIGYAAAPPIKLRLRAHNNQTVSEAGPAQRSRSFGIFALIVLLIALGIRYFGGLPPTVDSLVSLVRGDIGELARQVQISRLELTKGAYFGGEDRGQGLNTTLQLVGWSLLIAWAAAKLALDRSLKALLLLLVMILGSWIFVAGTGTRAPYLRSLFAGLIAYSLVRPIPLKWAVNILIGMVLVSVFLGIYSHKATEFMTGDGFAFWLAVQSIIDRLIFGNSANDVFAIVLSDEGILRSYIGQYHLRNFISAIPGVQGGLPLAYHLTEILGGGATTFRSGSYISTVYVDFGLVGIAVVFSMVGATFRILNTNLFPVKRSAWAVATASIWILNSSVLITGGFHSLIATSILTFTVLGLIWVLNEVWLMMMPRKKLRLSVPSRNGRRPSRKVF